MGSQHNCDFLSPQLHQPPACLRFPFRREGERLLTSRRPHLVPDILSHRQKAANEQGNFLPARSGFPAPNLTPSLPRQLTTSTSTAAAAQLGYPGPRIWVSGQNIVNQPCHLPSAPSGIYHSVFEFPIHPSNCPYKPANVHIQAQIEEHGISVQEARGCGRQGLEAG